jgi:hypothetical protein
MGKMSFAIASVVGLALALTQGSAFAALTKEEQACIVAMNRALGKVAKAQGRDASSCVRNAAKGKEADPDGCLTADLNGKVAKARVKTISDQFKKCTAGAPIGYTSGAAVNSAAVTELVNLAEDIFGDDLDPVVSTDKLIGACQTAVIKDVYKVVDASLKEWARWKKTELKNGAMTAADLENGLGEDPKGKIAKAINKLGDDITKKCTGVDAATAFPGSCSGSLTSACLDVLAQCRVCLMANAADDLILDCDAFDDGLVNGSCASPPMNIGNHKCTLDAGSHLTLHGALPLPPRPATGAIDITCGTAGGDGKAACDCQVQAPGFEPISIGGLYWLCVKPTSSISCKTGEIDCKGGTQLGFEMHGNRNIGACTSNANCATTCAAFCAPAGVFQAQCEGFCTGGAQMPCLADAACKLVGEGICNGPEGVGFGNICDCTCLDDATGGASDPGDLACQLALNLTTEGSPGNGIACDGADVLVDLGDFCAPLSTQSAIAALNNGNNSGVVFPPPSGFSTTGAPFDCDDLVTSDTSGAGLVGSVQFYGWAFGDINAELDFRCQ